NAPLLQYVAVNPSRAGIFEPADDSSGGIHVPGLSEITTRSVEAGENTVVDHIPPPFCRRRPRVLRKESGDRAAVGCTAVVHRRRPRDDSETVPVFPDAVHGQELVSVVNAAQDSAVGKNS